MEGGAVEHSQALGASTAPCQETEEPLGKKSIVAVIPAYNEERFIGSTVLKTRRHAQHVVVVDDGSTDATAQVAKAAGALVVSHPVNRGKGAALNSGFVQALELAPDVVVTIDADGQHQPPEMATVAAPIAWGQADIAVGSRYLRRECHIPRHRVWGHRLFNVLTNTASGVPVGDSQSGFRAFSPRAARALIFRSNGFSVESEMQFLAREHDLIIREVPITITYQDRPKRPAIAHGLQVLNGLLRIVGQYRPLPFFTILSAVFLASGGIWALYVADVYRRTRQLAIGHAFVCLLLIIAGSMALNTGLMLHFVRGMLLRFLRDSRQPGMEEKRFAS